jgi:heme-degrading monooxygenase HmoA
MFARVTRASGPPDKLDELIARYQKTLLPSIATRPGYLGGVLMVDRGSGAGRSMTFWQDESSMLGSEQMATEARAQVAQLGEQVEEPERYELVLQERVIAPVAGVFVRANDIRGSVERIDEMVEFARQQALPATKTQRGWRSMLVLVNRQNGRGLLLSIWDSAANREASEAAMRVLREQAGSMAGAGSIEVSLYEAVVVELNDPAAFPVGASQKTTA